jgi:hypothetical protein
MQHMSYMEAYRYPQWLMEGVAVYFSNQMGTSFYPGKDETCHAIEQGNYLPPFDFKTNREEKVQLNVKYRIAFMYSEFACIVEYLVAKYGKPKVLTYMKRMMNAQDHETVFKNIYGIAFPVFETNFRLYVSEYAVKSENENNVLSKRKTGP